MSKILTAREFLQDHLQISHFYDDKTNQMVCFSADVEKAMIEFAIEQIKDIDKKCFGGSNTCKAKIKELEQKLSEL